VKKLGAELTFHICILEVEFPSFRKVRECLVRFQVLTAASMKFPHLIVTHSPLVCPSFTLTTDSYIPCYPFARDIFIALMMEAVRTSETSVYSNETTRRYIPEGSNLQRMS
jgi:hypothetical protein